MGNFWEGLGYSVINEFLGLFLSRDGLAKSARYEVVIGPPSGIKSGGGGGGTLSAISQALDGNNNTRAISYNAETIAFPGRNLETKEDLSGYGPIRNVVMGSTYEDLSATFYVSNDHKEQKFFHEWQNTAYNMNASDNFGANYYYNYVGNIDIYQLDERDTRRLGVRVMEAFPKTIGSIEMGYANANQIEKMSVSFAYRYWEILPGGAGSSFLNRLANIAINQVERKLISKLPKVLTRL
jgi:hypothetical protein